MKKKVLLAVLAVAALAVSVLSVCGSAATQSSGSAKKASASVTSTTQNNANSTNKNTVVQKQTTQPPKIGNISKIQKTAYETTSISVKWSKASGATGYMVYIRDTKYGSSYKLVTKTTSTSHTIKKLSHTTPYYIKVIPYALKDGKQYYGTAKSVKLATRPADVGSVKATQLTSKYTELRWSRNSKATGYLVYRRDSTTNGEYVLCKTIKNNNSTIYVDKSIKTRKSYAYKVNAYFDLNGVRYYSNGKSIFTVAGLEVKNLSAKNFLSNVTLSWSKTTAADGYDIYYSTSQNGKYTKLASTKGTSYKTKKLSDKTYYFRVTPYKYKDAKKKTKVLGIYATKSIKVSPTAYGTNVGSTYIEISTTDQHMWFYVNGKLYCDTDVVTGNDDGRHNTTKGCFKIFQRSSPATLVGDDYETVVNYWLGFTYDGIGIHDSTWRPDSDYGGNTYKWNGSHGCVNTPYKAVQKIYNKARIGMYVVVY